MKTTPYQSQQQLRLLFQRCITTRAGGNGKKYDHVFFPPILIDINIYHDV